MTPEQLVELDNKATDFADEKLTDKEFSQNPNYHRYKGFVYGHKSRDEEVEKLASQPSGQGDDLKFAEKAFCVGFLNADHGDRFIVDVIPEELKDKWERCKSWLIEIGCKQQTSGVREGTMDETYKSNFIKNLIGNYKKEDEPEPGHTIAFESATSGLRILKMENDRLRECFGEVITELEKYGFKGKLEIVMEKAKSLLSKTI